MARENERRAALELEPLASIDELEATESSDVQLDQAARVVADMAALDAGLSAPELVTTSATAGD